MAFRSRSTLVIATLMIWTMSYGQTWLGAASFFGRQADARSEAMGRGNVALFGDVRTMGFNPASLMDLKGLDLYLHSARKWYLYDNSEFQQAAMAYRFGNRWALGVAVDGSDIGSSKLSFGDQIDPRRGFIYSSEDGFMAPRSRMNVVLASAPAEHLHIGVSVGNIPLDGDDQDVLYGSLGISHGGELRSNGRLRHSLRAAASMQNITFSEESNTGYRLDLHGQVDSVFRVVDRIPAILRCGSAYGFKWHGGWLMDTLSTFAVTVQGQYDNDLTQRFRTSIRLGGELVILEVLALRAGWYTESVDNNGSELNTSALEQFTYGFGLILPFGVLSKGTVPINVVFDYSNLPQVSYAADGLGIDNRPWENFTSIGLRINYEMRPLLKGRAGT